MTPKINPKYQHHCGSSLCLGEVVINDVRADIFVTEDLVIARFSEQPDDYEAQHLSQITMESNVFLITAFRLYLDERRKTVPQGQLLGGPSLQS